MISIAIIAKNEEDRLPECLKSAAFAEDIVVIDAESTDQTVNIAKQFGARVLVKAWEGYARQKQYAVDQCLSNWVLILDADERIPPETVTTIQKALADGEGTPAAAFALRRKNFLHGKWIKHCGWYPDRIIRLVDRTKGRFDTRLVHESWIAEGRVKYLEADIEHRSFRGYSDMIAKMENYSNLAAQDLFQKEKAATPCSSLTHGLWMFLRTYFWEMGFLDGFDGFMISTLNAGGSFLKYAKLKELIESKKNDRPQ